VLLISIRVVINFTALIRYVKVVNSTELGNIFTPRASIWPCFWSCLNRLMTLALYL